MIYNNISGSNAFVSTGLIWRQVTKFSGQVNVGHILDK